MHCFPKVSRPDSVRINIYILKRFTQAQVDGLNAYQNLQKVENFLVNLSFARKKQTCMTDF